MLAVGVLCAIIVLVTHPPEWLDPPGRIGLTGVAWVVFAVAVWLVRRVPARPAVVLILLGGAVLPVVAGFSAPRGSDDLYRYQWDGRVQAAGIDPYRYAPAAAELVGLRDAYLWPEHAVWCVPPGDRDSQTGAELVPGCTLVNRPAVHTIYPPVAQAYFAALHAMSPRAAGPGPAQLAAAALAIGLTVLLVVALPMLRLDPRRAALWAWCPTVALEAGNNAHVDVLAVLVAATAMLVLARSRTRTGHVLGGVLIGLAVATKVTPALVGPALLRRFPVTVLVAGAGAVATTYLPHVLAGGADVLGYLPGYLTEEGYADGTRFALLTLLVPASLAPAVAVVVLAALALVVARTTDPDRPWQGAVVLVGAALLVTTPGYSWYAMLLVGVVAFDGRAYWLGVAVAGYVALYARDLGIEAVTGQRLGYGAALAAVVVAVVVGVALARRARATPTGALPHRMPARASQSPDAHGQKRTYA